MNIQQCVEALNSLKPHQREEILRQLGERVQQLPSKLYYELAHMSAERAATLLEQLERSRQQ